MRQERLERRRVRALLVRAAMFTRSVAIACILSASAGILGVSACGGTDDAGSNRANPDGGSDAAIGTDAAATGDGGTDASTRPAPPPLELIPNNGGPIIKSPELVTVTWKGDDIAANLVAFDTWLPTSSLFTTMMAEWGVGAGLYGGAYSIDAVAPANMDDSAIQAVITDAINQGKVPAANGSRIYMIYPPKGTVVTTFGTGCTDFQAYHGSFQYAGEGGTALAVYSVTPRCADTFGMTPTDFTTWGASHEVMEASSDPDSQNPTWVILNQTPSTPQPGENADLCAGHPSKVEGHMVTLNYSNAAAKAGARPCVPAPAGPMFGIYSDLADVTVPPGTSVEIPIYAYADGPLPAFSVSAYASTTALTVTLGAKTAKAGDTLTLKIAASSAFTAAPGENIVSLYANSAGYGVTREIIAKRK